MLNVILLSVMVPPMVEGLSLAASTGTGGGRAGGGENGNGHLCNKLVRLLIAIILGGLKMYH